MSRAYIAASPWLQLNNPQCSLEDADIRVDVFVRRDDVSVNNTCLCSCGEGNTKGEDGSESHDGILFCGLLSCAKPSRVWLSLERREDATRNPGRR
jgi:hypothetical protein